MHRRAPLPARHRRARRRPRAACQLRRRVSRDDPGPRLDAADRRADERYAEGRRGCRAGAALGPPRGVAIPVASRSPRSASAPRSSGSASTRTTGSRCPRTTAIPVVVGRLAARRDRPGRHRRPRRLAHRPRRVLPAHRASQGRPGRRRPSRRQPRRFMVQGSERFPKDEFPTARVYGRTDGPRCASSPAWRLRAPRPLLDNTIVYAR